MKTEKRMSNVEGFFPNVGKDSKFYTKRCEAYKMLYERTGKGAEMTDWLTWPEEYKCSEEYSRLKTTAKSIRKDNDVVIVVGIGGSYLTPKMVIESEYGSFYNETAGYDNENPRIYFAGCDFSADRMNTILDLLHGERWCIVYISKSGGTIEPATSFRVLFEKLKKDYGEEEANKRVYAITDSAKGTLKGMADKYGWETFVIPDGIGGRYSGLTACGLLPIAIAGIDTDAILDGAIEAMKDCKDPCSLAGEYAEWRYQNYVGGRRIEFLALTDPYLESFGEWWKQLFGESEGKEGKGIFPASGKFPTDLHSMGQFLQEGTRGLIFETVLDRTYYVECEIAESDLSDNLDCYEGLTFSEATIACRDGSYAAHTAGGNPCAKISEERSLYSLGYKMQMLFVACAVYCYMIDVNPFDQPGVEEHKKRTRAILEKMKSEKVANS